ncbi:MAG: rRNA ((1498)-N(3))-methyltransferase [Hydrocarboniphaga sp.]|uniref:16S rRNA (uracil(1498)-N(3))-methyltransferase n=1 Tax=Hydrocarboniphaga sp. TaxID=2033016 RepID=UPI002617918F|nr:16S rRNA (uracil(1498)-N(3))-methyltransferase [Hydrocarboniphaga sp.]MDB5971323.1 rRNA ((1498)-N(3))-methyltransferase [Hydrocarboniphaga sp.]
MTRLYVDADLAVGQTLALPEDAFRHWVQVLRARVGDSVVLFNGRGGEYLARLQELNRRDASVVIERHVEVDRESALQLMLAQAVSKGDRMDYTLQKAVELGVSVIQPLVSERSVVKLDAERWDKKIEHWQGVVIAACEQSGRTRLPRLLPVLKLQAWLDQPLDVGIKLTLAPTAKAALRELPRQTSACLLIGPEGGLSDAEIAVSEIRGFSPVRLGPRVLRTETAGVAALSALQALWGDLG